MPADSATATGTLGRCRSLVQQRAVWAAATAATPPYTRAVASGPTAVAANARKNQATPSRIFGPSRS